MRINKGFEGHYRLRFTQLAGIVMSAVTEPMEALKTMQSEQLFEAAPGLSEPRYVQEAVFDAEPDNLAIQVSFRAGSHLPHAEAGAVLFGCVEASHGYST